ncbi:hypothetical protein FRB96_002860 [Tulasnella sp. 330]|nr:hypothetical protein FRB96_002860 [Tulasnella sp. 330]
MRSQGPFEPSLRAAQPVGSSEDAKPPDQDFPKPSGKEGSTEAGEPLSSKQESTGYKWAVLEADRVGDRWEVFKEDADLDSWIAHCKAALHLCPAGHPNRYQTFGILGFALGTRAQRTGDVTDVNESIDCYQEALSLYPVGHPDRGGALHNLSVALDSRYRQTGDTGDLTESIGYGQEALSLYPVGHPDRGEALRNLSVALDSRYRQTGDTRDLTESIGYDQEALSLYPVGHPDRGGALYNLSVSLESRHRQTGSPSDLSDSISYGQEALSLYPVGHPDRGGALRNLSVALDSRYRQTGNTGDHAKSIGYGREALSLYPVGHPDRGEALRNLSVALDSRYRQTGDPGDLTESIGYDQEALSLYPVGHPDRGEALYNLSVALDSRCRQTGDTGDLTETIGYGREALSLYPVGHPDRGEALRNLSVALDSRYKQTGDPGDLTESIGYDREALSLYPTGHPDRGGALHNLSVALNLRYSRTGNTSDLTESIGYSQDALSLYPTGHPDRGGALRGLSFALDLRYKKTRSISDLIESIGYDQEALSLCPVGHPDRGGALRNLSASLNSLYKQTRKTNDLSESIDHGREALSLYPVGHPDRGEALYNLSATLHSRYRQSGNTIDLIECIASLKEAASYVLSPLSHRLDAACYWISRARAHDSTSLTEAYSTSLTLLDRSVLLARSIHDRHARLTSKDFGLRLRDIVVDAASWAIHQDDLEGAVQILEQGRGMVFNQLGHYRTPIDVLNAVDEKLADRFRTVSVAVEELTLSNQTGSNEGCKAEDAVAILATEWDRVVEEIRQVEGFETFLRVTPFTTLQKAAADGPVILINISQYGSDAIIVEAAGPPLFIPLPEATPSAIEALVLTLNQAVGGRVGDDESNRLLEGVCQDTWRIISEPVVRVLENTLKLRKGSRIWWISTSAACSLPIHASGPYLPDQKNLLDRFLSSYALSLSSLSRARLAYFPVKDISRPRLLVVTQAEAEGETPLPNVDREMIAICKQVANASVLGGEECTREAVLTSLKDTEWVHFACHGHQDPLEPFKSHFSLRTRDAPLTLLDIISTGLPKAELAILSACHSAAGDSATPDEVIHLTAGMLVTGFRTVVGTMWAMADEDGPIIAEEFYKYMFRNGPEAVDCRDAAKGLSIGVKKLRRRRGIPFERWINFVHYGI